MEEIYVGLGTELVQFVQLFRVPFIDWLAPHLTRFGEAPVLLAAALVMLLVRRGNLAVGGGMLLALIIASAINHELKEAFHVPRPDPESVAALQHPSGTSMPSGHTMNAAAVWLFLALMLPVGRWRALAVGIPIVVGITRVYLGVHYPGDVVLGFALGALIALSLQALLATSVFGRPAYNHAFSLGGLLMIAFTLWELLE
jgi:undecaprenyl-diphosphatase